MLHSLMIVRWKVSNVYRRILKCNYIAHKLRYAIMKLIYYILMIYSYEFKFLYIVYILCYIAVY